MIYGYARCSTNETKQDINRQIRELKAAGAEEIFFEYEHGDATAKEQLTSLLDTAREGAKIAPCDCWQYHGGLHQGRACPHDKRIYTDVRRVCRA